MTIITRISECEFRSLIQLPYYAHTVPGGFPSPADDYMPRKLDLNEYLIAHPAATFFCRVSGQSMQGIGIMDGCLLVVDRSLAYTEGAVVFAEINGEMTCKILDLKHRQLRSGTEGFKPIDIPDDLEVTLAGIVIHAINSYAGPHRL